MAVLSVLHIITHCWNCPAVELHNCIMYVQRSTTGVGLGILPAHDLARGAAGVKAQQTIRQFMKAQQSATTGQGLHQLQQCRGLQ